MRGVEDPGAVDGDVDEDGGECEEVAVEAEKEEEDENEDEDILKVSVDTNVCSLGIRQSRRKCIERIGKRGGTDKVECLRALTTL